jgi:hypothetical protein
MKMLNKKLDENVVEKNTKHHEQKVAEQLYPPAKYGAWKNDVPVKEVPGWKRDGERHQESCDMRANGTGWCKKHLLLQDEVVGEEIKEDVKKRIAAAAGCISEGLDWHQFSEGRVEKVNYR